MSGTNLKHGVVGGLVGGLFFGAMMAHMGMLPMIGKMVGVPTAAAGFALHMLNSAVIGAFFALVLGRLFSSTLGGVGYGFAYGASWWLLGPLTLMPLFMGMGLGVNWSLAAASKMLPSLVGHLVYGGLLGLSYAGFRSRRGASCGVPCVDALGREASR